MARDVFHMTVAAPDASDMLVALEGVQVSVYLRGTTTAVTIYQAATGATQGSTPAAGATGGPNPFTTGPTGNVEFWADGPAELDVFVHDTVGPSRIADRRFGWNVMPMAAGSLPTTFIAQDGGMTLASLAADVKRQLHQIGEVIDWWRPDASVPIPTGFEICDGRQILAGSHDFPGLGGSNINLPDLRNRFVLGADSTKTHGVAAVGGDPVGDAPGIAGSGGSQQHQLTAVQSGVPVHTHTDDLAAPIHSHGSGTIATSAAVVVSGANQLPFLAGGPSSWVSYPVPTGLASVVAGRDSSAGANNVLNTQGSHLHAVTGSTGGASSTTLTGGVKDSTAAGAASAHNNTPRYIGLLKLMKVRRS